MVSLKTLVVGAALATVGCAQEVIKTGHLQAKSPDLGTVYLYKPQSDGGAPVWAQLGGESQAHQFTLRSDATISTKGLTLNIMRNQIDEKRLGYSSVITSDNGWKIVDGKKLVSDGVFYGYQDEFQACKYAGGEYFVYLVSHKADNMECVPLGALYIV
ncbi:unnamed protein product [Clonostachys chloroleuca]|uniref:Lipoprotein n=1 Tax=Clonostachys chloroleuca TaxID=1926264 RepID=A0AA35MFL6_9HYPO|nr:unnamed protein product [Clonostachys chloroleuca]